MTWSPDYVDVMELAEFLRIDDVNDDDQLELAITAASRSIDDHCNRQFGLVADVEERFYTARPDYDIGRWVIDIDDLMIVTGLSSSIDAEVLDADLKPSNAVAKGFPYTRLVVSDASTVTPTGIEDEVSVTARWGWSAVPDSVKLACLLQAARLFARRNSPFGVAGSPDLGTELRLLAKLDPDVAVSLRSFVRTRAVG